MSHDTLEPLPLAVYSGNIDFESIDNNVNIRPTTLLTKEFRFEIFARADYSPPTKTVGTPKFPTELKKLRDTAKKTLYKCGSWKT
jgi:hypothetical protein